MDNSDHQYASFRKNLPTLILVLSGYLIATFGIKQISRLDVYRKQSIAIKSTWYLLFSTVFLLALFGASALKVFAILSIHYILIKARPVQSISAPLLSWIFSISILLLNHFYDGYRFGSISNHLAFLDNVKGVGIRWNITFNFTVLRMISFAMDRYWSLKDPDVPSRLHLESCTICNESPNMCKRSRSETSHKVSDYNFFNYMLYCIYAPLYMAGPIVTFNDFLHQMKHTPRSINLKDSITYTLRWFAIVFLMEVMMHFSYVVAIKDTKAWKGFSPMEIFLVGFFNLKMIWLKLMIIWRFFRMWAMLDGVETLENMGRCMSNHYSGVQFWRDWHTSFNRWLIRYLYIPLGGAKTRGLNMFPIFSFVAMWHDIEGRLFAWGWMISLFILPELAFTTLFTTETMRKALGDYHLHICALGGTLNILMMMTANLVGFAVGVEGLIEMSKQILQPKGIFFMITVGFQLFGGTHRMFYWRSLEKTRS